MNKQECTANLNLLGFRYYGDNEIVHGKRIYPYAYINNSCEGNAAIVGLIRLDNVTPANFYITYDDITQKAIEIIKNDQTRVYSTS